MMEHKAFIFKYDLFEAELLPILRDALQGHECNELVSFIRQNFDFLSDPYEGEPLRSSWDSMIETRDTHQFGDFALTKYYDPADDIGLGTMWETVQKYVPDNRAMSPILGSFIGTNEAPFDPGMLGSYFQSHEQVTESRRFLNLLARERFSSELIEAFDMLDRAYQSQEGLYVTF
ncbi:hypothetical protein AB1L30_10065 [Bremerella sp. JC817]|uniref:hypothetical protein n=1 Tax=Bremerella sp. JC817 TaxID=3231756 RepID=UPI003457AC36